MIVCTVRLKRLLRISFKNSASRIGNTKPNTRLMAAIAKVFRIARMNSGFSNSQMKFSMPTHLFSNSGMAGL